MIALDLSFCIVSHISYNMYFIVSLLTYRVYCGLSSSLPLSRERIYMVSCVICTPDVSAYLLWLTHWARVTHICDSKVTTIGSDNGLSTGRRQAIIGTNSGILLIQTLGTSFSQILREIYTFSFKKMHFKMSSGKCRSCCLGLNVLNIVHIFHII